MAITFKSEWRGTYSRENTAKRDEYIFEEGEKSVYKKELKEEKKACYNIHEIILTLYTHNTYTLQISISPHTSIDHIQQTLHPCSTLPSHIHP